MNTILSLIPGLTLPGLVFLNRYFPFPLITVPLATLIGIMLSVKIWNSIRSAVLGGIKFAGL